MTFLRSSLFVLQQGGTNVDAGPSAVLTALRDAANRAVDQRQAAALIGTDWTTGLLFSRDHEPLTLLCLTSLVDPGEASAVILGRTAAELTPSPGTDEVKMQTYAMALVKQFGTPPVTAAVNRLREMRNEATTPPSAALTPAQAQAGSAPEAANPSRVLNSKLGETAWNIEKLIGGAQTEEIDPILGDRSTSTTISRPLLIDLRLEQVTMLQKDPGLSAAAADAIPDEKNQAIRDAAWALFGSHVRLAEDPADRARAIARIWDRPRGGPAWIISNSFPQLPAPSYPTLSGWVHAFALYELWSHLPDALAVEALTASLGYQDRIDARVARAAAHLRCGNRATAEDDLRHVVDGHARIGLDPVAPVDRSYLDRALRPLLGLLSAQDADVHVQRPLWDAAADATDALAAGCPRVWALSAQRRPDANVGSHRAQSHPDRSTEWIRMSKGEPGTGNAAAATLTTESLARLATDVAASIPYRAILTLRADLFFDPSGTTPTPEVDGSLLTAVREHLAMAANPGTRPDPADVQKRLNGLRQYVRSVGDDGF